MVGGSDRRRTPWRCVLGSDRHLRLQPLLQALKPNKHYARNAFIGAKHGALRRSSIPSKGGSRVMPSQRISLITMLWGIAVMLHSLFFEWSTDWAPSEAGYLFSPLLCRLVEPGCLRLWYDSATFQNPLLSVVMGILLPLVLLCGAIYLWLGSRPFQRTAGASAKETQ